MEQYSSLEGYSHQSRVHTTARDYKRFRNILSEMQGLRDLGMVRYEYEQLQRPLSLIHFPRSPCSRRGINHAYTSHPIQRDSVNYSTHLTTYFDRTRVCRLGIGRMFTQPVRPYAYRSANGQSDAKHMYTQTKVLLQVQRCSHHLGPLDGFQSSTNSPTTMGGRGGWHNTFRSWRTSALKGEVLLQVQ